MLNDNTLQLSRSAGRWSDQKNDVDLDARTKLLESLTLTTGVGWERWDRNSHREVPVSDEFFAKAALDATPTDWLLAWLTYVPSFQRIDQYNTTTGSPTSRIRCTRSTPASRRRSSRKCST